MVYGAILIDLWLYFEHRCGHARRLSWLYTRHVGAHHRRYSRHHPVDCAPSSMLPTAADLDLSVVTPLVVLLIAATLGGAAGAGAAATSLLGFVWHGAAHAAPGTRTHRLSPRMYKHWHLLHHTTQRGCNYGIVSPLGDFLFGTLSPDYRPSITKQNLGSRRGPRLEEFQERMSVYD